MVLFEHVPYCDLVSNSLVCLVEGRSPVHPRAFQNSPIASQSESSRVNSRYDTIEIARAANEVAYDGCTLLPLYVSRLYV